MEDNTFEWSWGKAKAAGNVLVFETKEIEGGYKCLFCDIKLNKRWDGLTGHVVKCKKKPHDYNKSVLEKVT